MNEKFVWKIGGWPQFVKENQRVQKKEWQRMMFTNEAILESELQKDGPKELKKLRSRDN